MRRSAPVDDRSNPSRSNTAERVLSPYLPINSGAITSVMVLSSLMTTCSDGPAVS